MIRTMFKSKIHRATVTQADLHYVGSLTVDQDLMDAADLLPGEQVQVVDIDNGARLETAGRRPGRAGARHPGRTRRFRPRLIPGRESVTKVPKPAISLDHDGKVPGFLRPRGIPQVELMSQ